MKHRIEVFWLVLFFSLLVSPRTTTAQNNSKNFSHFEFATIYVLWIDEAISEYQPRLIDEHGIQYDTHHLLNFPGRFALQVTSEQHKEIDQIYKNVANNIRRHEKFAQLEEHREVFYKIYLKAEEDMKKVLNKEQKSNLKVLFHLKAIEKIGLAKYLTSSHFNGGKELPVSAKDELNKINRLLKRELWNQKHKRMLKFNNALMSGLSKKNRRIFVKLLDEDAKQAMAFSPLIPPTANANEMSIKRIPLNAIYFAKRKVIRERLGLSSDEKKKIRK